MGVDPNWGILLQGRDPGQAFTQGMEMGRQRREEQNRKNALAAYAQNPQDEAALNALAPYDPGLVIQQRQQQAQAAQQQQQQERKIIGSLAKVADNPQAWDATIDQLEQMGVQGVGQYRGRFSPEARRALMVAGGVADDGDKQTAMQQNYEWLKTVNPQAAEDYIKRQTSEPPMIASNGDGTFTIIPRSNIQGGTQSGPAPGTIEDGYRFKGGNPADQNNWEPVGGQTAAPSGTFQP